MALKRQPLMTLSPSQFGYQSCLLSTTPKLPRKDRTLTSRRLAAAHFSPTSPQRCWEDAGSFRTLPDNDVAEGCVSSIKLLVSECSPEEERMTTSGDEGETEGKGSGSLGTHLLPFSPPLPGVHSPTPVSPRYRCPTPTRSPLYTPNRKKHFLGRGSFGNVTLCRHKGTEFALKVIHHQGELTSVGESNLLDVRHPHLVRILSVVRATGQFFVCMEYAGRCNLQHVLDTKSELDFQRRLSFCWQIASGLDHCHRRRIAHGDVKPANVLVSPYGVCKLGDFGHSVQLDGRPQNPKTCDVIGTAAYAAPEVLTGQRIALASDVYSFGVLLWQVYTREAPFAGEHPHVVIYRVVHYHARPPFRKATDRLVESYIDLTKKCWSSISRHRPSTKMILAQIQQMLDVTKEFV